MIRPSIVNLSAIQGSTFQQDFIITDAVRDAAVNGDTDTVISPCHRFIAGDRVAFASEGSELPCGLTGGVAYFVIASGLTAGEFKVSATLNGAAIDIHSTGSGSNLKVGKVLDLTTYTLNADITAPGSGGVIESFTCIKTDAVSGRLRLLLSASETQALYQREYDWYLKLSTAQEVYFYAKGLFSLDAV
jgi:hypothetical protein